MAHTIRLAQLFGTAIGRNGAPARIINMNHVRMLEYDESFKELRIEFSNGQATTLKGDAALDATAIESIQRDRSQKSTFDKAILDQVKEFQQTHVDPCPAAMYA